MSGQIDEEILKARVIIRQKIADGEELTKKWSYIMVCDTVEQVDKLMKEDHFLEASKNGMLTRDEAQELCDMVFGEEKFYSRLIFLNLIENNKVNTSLSEEERQELKRLKQKIEQMNRTKDKNCR